jgi:hypothetical protein
VPWHSKFVSKLAASAWAVDSGLQLTVISQGPSTRISWSGDNWRKIEATRI